MLVLIVNFTIKPGSETQAIALMRKMEEHTRKEPGCRCYTGYQSAEDPRQFGFYEQYDDQPAMDAHRAAPYFAEYITNGLVKLMEGTRTRRLFRTLEEP
jgi:quinol monooxygenase YgiN